MVTENNSQINTFTGGMNTDTSYQSLLPDRYISAKNIRVSATNRTGESDASNVHGVIRPIEGVAVPYNFNFFDIHGIPKDTDWSQYGDHASRILGILAADVVRNYGVIIAKVRITTKEGAYGEINRSKDGIAIYRIEVPETPIEDGIEREPEDILDDVLYTPQLTCVWQSFTTQQDGFIESDNLWCEELSDLPNRLSIQLRWEDDDNVKLYIATTVTPLLVFNISPTHDSENQSHNGTWEHNSIYPSVTFEKPIFAGYSSGTLPAGLVQYSYSFYNKNGQQSEISPSTRLIPIVKWSNKSIASSYDGYLDEETSQSGVSIKIPIKYNKKWFTYLKIYRIYYALNGQAPTVGVIYDAKFLSNYDEFANEYLSATDSGQTLLEQLTLEEYNSVSGIHIIPKVLESKNDYLFAANIKTPNTLIEGELFKEWDARAYQSDYNGICLIKQYGTDNVQEFNILDLTAGGIDIPQDADCFNPINDMNEEWRANEKTDYKYDEYGYYGGTGKNVSWRFVISQLYGDHSLVPKGRNYYYNVNGTRVPTLGTASRSLNTENTKVEVWLPHKVYEDWDYGYNNEGRRYADEPNNAYLAIDNYSGNDTPLKVSSPSLDDISYIEWLNKDITFNANTIKSYYIKAAFESDEYGVSFEEASIGDISNTAKQYFDGIGASNTYADPQAMYFLKSLRRDELYRYGIILYDKFGSASPVKWIADIRTPSVQELGFLTFASHVADRDLAVRPLGILFIVSNLPEDCAGYEIVRCNRSYADIANITQGVISRPIKKKVQTNYTGTTIEDCYTPTGFLTTARFWTGVTPGLITKAGTSATDILSADNFTNHNVFQFVSPEVVYQFENMKSVLTDNSYYISPVRYVFGQSNINSGVDDFQNTPIGDVNHRDGYEYTGNDYADLYRDGGDIDNVPVCRNNIILHPGFGNVNLQLFRMSLIRDDIMSSAFASDYRYRGEVYPSLDDFDTTYGDNIPVGTDQVHTTLYWYTENGRAEANTNLAIGIAATSVKDAFFRINAKGTSLSAPWETLVKNVTNYSQINNVSTLNPAYSLYKKNPKSSAQLYHVSEKNKDFFEKNGAYIKLYELADTVISRALTKSFGDDVLYAGGVKNKIYGKTLINNISFAEDLLWNDFLSSEAVDADNVQLLYPEKISVIGTNEYCNFVTGGLYNVQFGKYNGEDKYGLYLRYRDLHNNGMLTASGYSYPQGPGGRCILLQTDDPLIIGNDAEEYGGKTRLLSETIGCDVILTHEYGPYSQNLSSEDFYNEVNRIRNLDASVAEPTIVKDYITLSSDREDNYTERFGERDYVHRIPRKNINLVYKDVKGNDKPLFRNSIAGTFICNLRKPTTPYGGYSYQNRMENVYYSYGNYFTNSKNENTDSYIFDGDCIIYPLEYVSMHKAFSADFDDETLKPTTQITYAIPLESTICVPYSSGEEFSKRVLKLGDPYKATTLQIQPDNISGIYTQSKPMYEYNTVYNTNSTSRVFAAYNYALDEDYDGNNMDYRCYYSNLKTNDEIIDSWTKFQSANYIDVDTKYGPITQLKKFNNSLMFWQQSAFGKLSVNERVQISTDSNTPIILGNGGILDRYDYIDTTSGMAKDQYCTTISNAALYWWDAHNQEIKSYRTGNSVVRLSKQGRVQSKMHEKENQVIPTMFFDLKYDELVSNVLTEDNKEHVQIAYNEQFNVFTSLYDIDYSDQLQFPTRTYLINISDQALDIAQWNKLQSVSDESKDANVPRNIDGSPLLTSITFAVNRSPVIAKVFDNQEIVSPNILGDIKLEGNSRVPYFKKHDGNETGAVEYTWKTDIAETSSDNLDMTYREGNYRYAIPRETIDGTEAKYGNRMRGKYMVCSIDDTKPNYNAAISYIITKFRVSWA